MRADDVLIRAKGHDAGAKSQIASTLMSLETICPGLHP